MNNQASITALMSSFGRAFHAENEDHPVFTDHLAKNLMTEEEYAAVQGYILGGAQFFEPEIDPAALQPKELLCRLRTDGWMSNAGAYCRKQPVCAGKPEVAPRGEVILEGDGLIMSKRIRQYLGILAALAAYYFVHEGAHLLYALLTGVFKQIRLMGLGVQIDVYAEHMTNMQLGIFCLVGALATFCVGYLLAALAKNICRAQSKLLRAMLYYITIAFLLLDPLYLSVLCGFFGGGDMNGIALLCPEWEARCFFGVLLLVNGVVFWKRVLPVYRQSFSGR